MEAIELPASSSNGSTFTAASGRGRQRGQEAVSWWLFSEQIRVLLLLELVHGGDLLVGDLLDFFEAAPFVVFRDGVVLEQLLEAVVGLAPDASDTVAPFF